MVRKHKNKNDFTSLELNAPSEPEGTNIPEVSHAFWRIASYLALGFLGPGVAIVVFVAAWVSQRKGLGAWYPWKIVFCTGILFSLWIQCSLAWYFKKNRYPTSAKFHTKRATFYEILDWSMPILMPLIVMAVLLMIDFFYVHILLSLLYMGLVCLWDWSIWRASEAVSGCEEEYNKYKHCCRQLLIHVDGAVFSTVFIWMAIIVIGTYLMAYEHITFSFSSEVTDFLNKLKNDPLTKISDLHKHELKEPLMGGIIGFHMIFSVILLILHFIEWETKEGENSNTRGSTTITPATQTVPNRDQ